MLVLTDPCLLCSLRSLGSVAAAPSYSVPLSSFDLRPADCCVKMVRCRVARCASNEDEYKILPYSSNLFCFAYADLGVYLEPCRRVVGRMQAGTEFHFSPSTITCHLSAITRHLSPVTYPLSPITYHLSRITYHVSHITYHLSVIHSLIVTCILPIISIIM